MTMSTSEHGARPVPLMNAAASFTAVERPLAPDALLPADVRAPTPPLPDDRSGVLDIARRPLRSGAVIPVVGREGGVGRTTVTRLLAAAFFDIRGEHPVAVDSVLMWGGLTAAADQPGECSAADIMGMRWPIPWDELSRVLTTVDGLPTMPCPSPIRGVVCDAAVVVSAVERLATIAPLTIVDTVADVAGSPSRELIWNPTSTVVWVASATRSGLWGIAEVLVYFRAIGAEQLARRSVVAVVGGRRRWPADAAAAEAQLHGLGVETVRVPCSAHPLRDSRCKTAAERLLAAVVARSG